MIRTVVVGYGLAGREFHCPLIARQPDLSLYGVVARDARKREQAEAERNVKTFASLDAALDDPEVDLVVLATPHDTHAEMTVKTLDSGRNCVVDKVMALSVEEADRMIAARDRSGKMLSVFHNRRWDWDFATIKEVLAQGLIGKPLLFESAVCRFKAPQGWRGELESSGTILHDWGAHMIDHALQLGLGPCHRVTAWLFAGPWKGVNNGGHGRIFMEFDNTVFQAETSRICRIDRPRWWIVGTEGGFVKYGIDPQEDALRGGDVDSAHEPDSLHAVLSTGAEGDPNASVTVQRRIPPVRAHWDGYYANIAAHLMHGEPLAVTAEQGRDVVAVLDAAVESSREGRAVDGSWGG
jgi:scyllo-inositol 2-dehydrogenase (NADP+)